MITKATRVSVPTRMAGVLTLAMLWQAAAAAQNRVCWVRDAVSPAPVAVYLLCEQGTLMATSDGGATWSTHDIGQTGHLRAMDFTDAAHGIAVGDAGLLVATENGGKSWEPRKSGVTDNLLTVEFVGQSAWTGGYDGVLLHSPDGGRTWVRQKSGTQEALESIFFLDAQRGWAVGWAGTIIRTTDGGQSWLPVQSDAASWSLSSVYFRDAQNGWIVGFGGIILRSRDGGVTWTAQNSPVKTWLTSVRFENATRGWIASDDSLLVSEDGGESWRTISVEEGMFLSQLLPVGNSLWAVGQLGILKKADTSLAWKKLDNLVLEDYANEAAFTADSTSHLD